MINIPPSSYDIMIFNAITSKETNTFFDCKDTKYKNLSDRRGFYIYILKVILRNV